VIVILTGIRKLSLPAAEGGPAMAPTLSAKCAERMGPPAVVVVSTNKWVSAHASLIASHPSKPCLPGTPVASARFQQAPNRASLDEGQNLSRPLLSFPSTS
jgi:hypothetical protein